jgi:hypothetical protein
MLSKLNFFFILFQYYRYISLSHYFSAMNNAQPPKEVAIVILEAIKNASNSSESLFRYTVGGDAKTFAQAKNGMSDSQLHEFISNKLLR